MRSLINLIFTSLIFYSTFFLSHTFSQDQSVGEILEIIQKDLRTLERAVYSQSFSENGVTNKVQKASTKEWSRL